MDSLVGHGCDLVAAEFAMAWPCQILFPKSCLVRLGQARRLDIAGSNLSRHLGPRREFCCGESNYEIGASYYFPI